MNRTRWNTARQALSALRYKCALNGLITSKFHALNGGWECGGMSLAGHHKGMCRAVFHRVWFIRAIFAYDNYRCNGVLTCVNAM